MLIKEIVTRQEPILLELTYDPNLVKDVPNYRGVKFTWDKNVKLFKSAKTGEFIPKTDPVHRALIKQPVNKPARRATKKPGIGSRISGALGMDGVLAGTRGTQRGIAGKIGSGAGNIIGRAMDNLAGATARGIQNFKKGMKDAERERNAPENQLDDFNYKVGGQWKDGDVDPRKFIKDPKNFPATTDRRYKNPNYNKTIGKDHFILDWPSVRQGKAKTPGQTKKLTPKGYDYGAQPGGFQQQNLDPNLRNVNNPADDMANLKILVQKNAITQQDANDIIAIANDGGFQLNKAYGIWQKEKNPAAQRYRRVTDPNVK